MGKAPSGGAFGTGAVAVEAGEGAVDGALGGGFVAVQASKAAFVAGFVEGFGEDDGGVVFGGGIVVRAGERLVERGGIEAKGSTGAPETGGDLFDQFEFEGVCREEFVDAALAERGEGGVVFTVEDDVFVSGKAVLEAVAGDVFFALGADRALGFGAIAAGDFGFLVGG